MSGVRPSPVERFLGREATRAGPFGLLRLTPETCTDERIIASLEWQLDRVGQHAEGDTPEADEVRLALHAAAAQLLDPNVRRHVLAVLKERGEGALDPAVAPPVMGSGMTLTGLEQDALRTLAAYGGWNKQSLERLKSLAYARGMGSQEVAQTLRNLSTGRRRPAAARPAAPGAGARAVAHAGPVEEAHDRERAFVDPGARYVRNLLLAIGGVVGFLVVLVIVAALVLTSGSRTAPNTTGAPGAPVVAAPTTTPMTPAPTPSGNAGAPPATPAATAEATPAFPQPASKPKAAAPTFADPQLLVRALAECATQARREPEMAADKLPPLVEQLASMWPKLEQSQRRAADGAVLETVFATATYPEVSARVLESIVAGSERLGASDALAPGETWPGVWSVGVLTRLSRERELPHSLANLVDRALTAAIGRDRPRTDATFESGALAALRRIPERLVAGAPPESKKSGTARGDELLRPWLDALGATAGADAELKERMLVDAMERILTVGAEPSVDQRVFDGVQTLATEIKWRKGGAARSRLLDWFRDPRVSMQDLRVVTAALASRSSAEGVDPMMVLSVGATTSDRQRLRTAYAKAWGIAESVGEDAVSTAWLEAARKEVERSTEGMRRTDFLVRTVTLARLNEAGTRLWRGESDGVASTIEAGMSLPDSSLVTTAAEVRRVLSEHGSGDGAWTASYHSIGRNLALRQEKLAEMEKVRSSIGPVDAEQLVYLACFETPAELRGSAQRAVIRLASEASVVNAALEILPRAPRYTSVAALFEEVARRSLPSPASPTWELEARRALVARLLELLAAAGEDAKIDDLAAMLFDAYGVRAGRPPGVEGEGAESGGARGQDAAGDLGRAWRADAEAVAPNEHAPVTLDDIDRRRLGRLRLARGPVQLFAAEQVSTAELMAYVVSAERPALAKQVRAAIEEMAEGRRKSTHIFEQLAHTERAMLRLWLLRISGEQP